VDAAVTTDRIATRGMGLTSPFESFEAGFVLAVDDTGEEP